MMVSGPKARSVSERYNIFDDTDLRLAAERQESYLEGQNGYHRQFQECETPQWAVSSVR